MSSVINTNHSHKRVLRARLKSFLRQIPQTEINNQSAAVLEALKPLLADYKHIACFMSMDRGEVVTTPILKWLFQAGKTVYLPRCTSTDASGHINLRNTGKPHPHLTFHRMRSYAAVESLRPQGKYQLREPLLEIPHPLPPKLDVILVPGVAFSPQNGARMGHGAGFYDDFIHRTLHHHAQKPLLVGLALQQQLVQDIPMEQHDNCMDAVVSGDGSIHWVS
ncbi:LAMI_0C03290g1_1 [Lachancea mirantina]|uniref:5-formyltetrahydrofolate cyclo-ligase n=1 Tax=Lachancea mirantina TaxID=1230905 RepID=A0A1G4J1T5_9SACH|nr:LAMI_0C03290g1_1 [Lachancea mirantina]